eukprot:10271770-Heterocapsa_arctica.AAC.1
MDSPGNLTNKFAGLLGNLEVVQQRKYSAVGSLGEDLNNEVFLFSKKLGQNNPPQVRIVEQQKSTLSERGWKC